VHVREIATTVNIFGLSISDGDLIHADRHGALVIPLGYETALAVAIAKLLDTEKIVLSAARAEDFDFAAFEAAWTAFEAART
jgi:regulator of RNase E activity RraA